MRVGTLAGGVGSRLGHPPPRFGQVALDGDLVVDHTLQDAGINGAVSVCEPGVFDHISDNPGPPPHSRSGVTPGNVAALILRRRED